MSGPNTAAELTVLHSSDGMVDLFILDASALGGSVEFFSPQCYSNSTLLAWGGQAYSLVPIGIDSLEKVGTASNLPQPTLIISNAGTPILAMVIALGDLVGAKLTHYKVRVSNLDGQQHADVTKFVGPEVWYVFQKTTQTNQSIAWTLASPMDMPGMQFPARQILKYANINPGLSVYFPGVSTMRMSGT
jgi:lambda family phage minor tail protein L